MEKGKKLITKEALQQAIKQIDENNQEKIPMILQKEWFRKLKRAVAIGSQQQYQELIQQLDEIEPFDYKTTYQQKDPTKNTILHNACLNYRKHLVQYLLDNGFEENVNSKNLDGETPCMQAIINICVNNRQKLDLIYMLVNKGADILILNKDGKNIVEIAKKICTNESLIQKIEELYTLKRRERDQLKALFFMKYTKIGQYQHPIYSKLNNWIQKEIVQFI